MFSFVGPIWTISIAFYPKITAYVSEFQKKCDQWPVWWCLFWFWVFHTLCMRFHFQFKWYLYFIQYFHFRRQQSMKQCISGTLFNNVTVSSQNEMRGQSLMFVALCGFDYNNGFNVVVSWWVTDELPSDRSFIRGINSCYRSVICDYLSCYNNRRLSYWLPWQRHQVSVRWPESQLITVVDEIDVCSQCGSGR